MFWRFLVILFLLLLLIRVRITFYIAYIGRFLWAIDIRVGPIHLPEINQQRFERFRLRHPSKPSNRVLITLRSSLKKTRKARYYLRKRIQIESLEGTLRLSLADAAKTALLTGAFSSLIQLVTFSREHIRFDVLPDFTSSTNAGKAKGIISFRLGTLFVSLILLLLSEFPRHRTAEVNLKEA